MPLDQLKIDVTHDTVTASDQMGRTVWTHAVDPVYKFEPTGMMGLPWRIGRGPNPGVFVGFDIGTRRTDNVAVSGRLVELDPATGVPRRSFSFDDEVVLNGVKYEGPWSLSSFAVEERGGSRRIAVTGHHFHWDASIVTILDESFQRRGTYVQAGWLEQVHWPSPDRLIAAGFNNAHDGGSMVLLDPDHLDGQAPEPPTSKYYCQSCPAGTPLRSVVMPRSELNRVTVSRFNRVSFQAMPDRLVASTIEIPFSDIEAIAALYEFTPSLDLLRASFAARYWNLHDLLFEQGKISHRSEDCPDRNGPREILVWDAKNPGWMRMPIGRSRDGA